MVKDRVLMKYWFAALAQIKALEDVSLKFS